MTGVAELHAQALDATGRILRGVPADCWHAATPGAGWDARALVNHLVSGNLWAAELAADGTIEGGIRAGKAVRWERWARLRPASGRRPRRGPGRWL